MFSKLLENNFWFSQPSSFLSQLDQYLAYFFVACLALTIAVWAIKRFSVNQVKIKILNKFFYLFLTIGLSGLVWYGFRYENTPIFALRAWAGLVLLIGLIWVLFIVKYLIFGFPAALKEYDREMTKSKYIPGPKTR
ncbi:MAG: hypothetical protein ABI643_04340 [Candidatus Doudnabacteria bacterium]